MTSPGGIDSLVGDLSIGGWSSSDSDEFYSPISTPEMGSVYKDPADELHWKGVKPDKSNLTQEYLDLNKQLNNQDQEIKSLTQKIAFLENENASLGVNLQKEIQKSKEKDNLLRKMDVAFDKMRISKNPSPDAESRSFLTNGSKILPETSQSEAGTLPKGNRRVARLSEDISVSSSNDVITKREYTGKSRSALTQWENSLHVLEKKLYTDKEQFDYYYVQRKKELDKREDKIIKKEVYLFNQKIGYYTTQAEAMGLDSVKEQLKFAQHTMNEMSETISKLEYEKEIAITESKLQDYHSLNKIIRCKTEEVAKFSQDNHEKDKEIHLLKLELDERNKEIRNYLDVIQKLKAVQNVFVEGEKERYSIREKIKTMKTHMSQQSQAKPGLKEDLEMLENKLESLELQIFSFPLKPELEEKASEPHRRIRPEVFANTSRCYSRFLSKATQTDCTLDAFWQVSEREDSIRDQLWFLKNRKTAVEEKEQLLKAKEKELNRLDDFLKTEKTKLAVNTVRHFYADENDKLEIEDISRASHVNQKTPILGFVTEKIDDNSNNKDKDQCTSKNESATTSLKKVPTSEQKGVNVCSFNYKDYLSTCNRLPPYRPKHL